MPKGSLDGLEDRVTKDREALAQSLDALSRTLAPQHLSRTAEEYGNQMIRTVTDQARENPAAFALLGAGLAMVLTGAGRRSKSDALEAPVPPGGVSAIPAPGSEARLGPVTGPRDRRFGGQSGDGTHGVSAARLRSAMEHGLDKLSPAARNRVRRARQQVIDAQEALERRASKAARQSDAFVRDQPIAAGALAFGFGAIAAALLPGTRTEDRMMGSRRDALMAEATLAFEREMEQAKAELRRRAGVQDGAQGHSVPEGPAGPAY
ncbi:hypothetical protein [Citreimonas sp.]|uniref:hypothetical protein n=1 Tax=Citreimonas sp. TaxID=3036715 RepID=UPI004057D19A